jgi:hypothetical protein
MANEIILSGFKEFQGKLKSLPIEIKDEADLHVQYAAERWEELAKLDAPIDQGGAAGLVGGIKAAKIQDMVHEVVSAKHYSPYVEWGTGTRVSVPADLRAYAIQFKGIKKVIGRYPHPYFFIQKPIVERELIANLRKLLETPR